MASNDRLILNTEQRDQNQSIAFDLNDRKNRLTLWCILYYIYSVTSLTATSLLLKNEDYSNDWAKHANRTYVAGACFILLATLITMVNLHYISNQAIYKFVSGIFFIIGGILHIAANSTIIHHGCIKRSFLDTDDSWCRIIILFPDFMAQYLTIIVGLDIMTIYGDNRKIRLIAYNAIVCICMLLAASWINHKTKDNNSEYSASDDTTTMQVGLFITGIMCGIICIALSCVLLIQNYTQHEANHKHKETIHLLIGFILLSAIGLVFLNGMVLYQMLLVLSTVVMIAYDLQFV